MNSLYTVVLSITKRNRSQSLDVTSIFAHADLTARDARARGDVSALPDPARSQALARA